jgi:hypothetical protein
MRPWFQRMASLVAVLALIGTPSVVAACALLCLPGADHRAAETGPSSAAHADCHGSQAAPATGMAAVADVVAADTDGIGAMVEHSCCPDALGLPAISSPGGRGAADHLTLVAVSSIARTGGHGRASSRVPTRPPDIRLRSSLASAPLVLRI